MPEILFQYYINSHQYSTYKPDFQECRVFKKYDREGV